MKSRCRPGSPQHPVNADDHHRGIDAEVLAASAAVGDVVVAELHHQSRPAASDMFESGHFKTVTVTPPE